MEEKEEKEIEEQKEKEEQEKKDIEEKEKLEKPEVPESTSLITQAREERKLMETATEKAKEERIKGEKLAADLELAGDSKVDTTPAPTEHDEYVAKAKERYAGTGRDPTIGFKRKF